MSAYNAAATAEILRCMEETGISREILNDLFRDFDGSSQALAPLIVQAVERSEQHYNQTPPGSAEAARVAKFVEVMKPGWRPPEVVVTLLTSWLGITRIDLGYYREAFIREFQGKPGNYRQRFLRYAVLYHEKLTAPAAAPQGEPDEPVRDRPRERAFTEDELALNRLAIRQAAETALNTGNLGRVMNIADTWAPPAWVLEKLEAIDIDGRRMSRKFIFDPTNLQAFISHRRAHPFSGESPAQAFYEWTRTRFFKKYALLQKELGKAVAAERSARDEADAESGWF